MPTAAAPPPDRRRGSPTTGGGAATASSASQPVAPGGGLAEVAERLDPARPRGTGTSPTAGASTHEQESSRDVSWLGSGDVAPEQVAARCEALRVGISELIHVVAITIEGGDDPQMIFETLNARGTPLLAMDLVKNATFMRLTLAGSDTARLHDDVWHPELGQDYWREEVGRGRLARPRAELFLLHWLTMKLGRTVQCGTYFPHSVAGTRRPRRATTG